MRDNKRLLEYLKEWRKNDYLYEAPTISADDVDNIIKALENNAKYESAYNKLNDMYFDTKKQYVNECCNNKMNKIYISFLQDKLSIVKEMISLLKGDNS